MKQIEPLKILHEDRVWVAAELERLYGEWITWQSSVAQIIDQAYDRSAQTQVFADGEDNIQKHEILQSKTLTFLNQNIGGHGFIQGFDGTHIDRTDLRLSFRVKHRVKELEELRASLQYAEPKGKLIEGERDQKLANTPNQEVAALEGSPPQPVASEPQGFAAFARPEKLTMKWLYEHAPMSFYFWGAGLLVTAFGLGVGFSETIAYQLLRVHAIEKVSPPSAASAAGNIRPVHPQGKLSR